MQRVTATNRTRVVVADDHPVIRAGLRHILDGQPGIEVVGEAVDGRMVADVVGATRPDVVVMDVSMPQMNGIEAIRGLRRHHPRVRIVVLSVHCSESIVVDAIEAGAVAYVLKEAASEELAAAIQAAARGQGYLSPPVAKMVAARLSIGPQGTSALTSRERQVVQLLSEGASVREAAARLFVSVATIKTHRTNAMRKVDARNLADLVRYAIREGLVTR
jgi:DNA-binding NarL/FixJ family response regulator